MFGLNDREMNREIERMRDEEHCGSTDMEDIFNAPYDEVDYKHAEMVFGLNKKDIDLILSVDLTKEESVIPTNNDSEEESKMTTTNLNKVLKKDLIQMVADLQAELAAKAVSVQPTQTTNKGAVTVKTTRQGRFTQEEMDAMKAAAIAGNKAVSAPMASKEVALLSIDSDVAKSILINFNKKDHAWASAKQMSYMKYKAVKGVIEGIEVPAGGFVMAFSNKATVDYFLCTKEGVTKRYRIEGSKVVEVKVNKSVSGIDHPNKAFTLPDGTKVGVTCKESNGLKSGEIVYANGTRFAYQWNNSKYNMPKVTGAGFAYKDLPVMKSLLLAYFNEILKEVPVVIEEVKAAPVVEMEKQVAESVDEYFDPSLYA